MKKFTVLVSIFLFTGVLFADNFRGRDIAEKGKLQSIAGLAIYMDGEWYVENSTGRYIIHMGPEFYRDEIGIKLEKNDKIQVRGYVFKNDIAPQTIEHKNKIYKFRDSDGKPLWAGRGNRSRAGDKKNN